MALLAQHSGDRLAVAIFLAGRMLDAAGDLESLGYGDALPALPRRFLGWLTRRDPNPD